MEDQPPSTPDLVSLSLGGGVQSSALLLMSCRGDLPKPDVAIFADTEGESGATYRYLADVLEPAAREAGIPLVRVGKGPLAHDALTLSRSRPSLPYKTLSRDGEPGYMAHRDCTRAYKTRPIDAEIRRRLGGSTRKKTVETWLGISTDEIGRMKQSRHRWQRLVYPLIDLRMSRADCKRWVVDHGYPPAPRSACVFCPNHSDSYWRAMRDGDPETWAQVVAFDAAARNALPHMDSEVFLHAQRVPLSQVDLATPQERGQLGLFGDDEQCADASGACFL
jgi:hypothetical protein